MYIQMLKNLMTVRDLNQSDIARLGGLSRAAVSKWFCQNASWVNVESETMRRLAAGLGLPLQSFLEEKIDLSPLATRFLWDALYPNMEGFVQALLGGQPPALARLVQVLGFRDAVLIIGKKVLTLFERYKKFIKPIRRQQLELIWPLYSSQI